MMTSSLETHARMIFAALTKPWMRPVLVLRGFLHRRLRTACEHQSFAASNPQTSEHIPSADAAMSSSCPGLSSGPQQPRLLVVVPASQAGWPMLSEQHPWEQHPLA